ncbi:protein disulfide oxidoreductase [Neisseria dumasiana]|uniref:Protein disulfide oxidoreductase n=1 Tax=Neisseria dumasiana TaxID=1931275 RepID=A0ABX3WM51_9NEIS|nr:protein disulfide oxidoreductase [Neisseria dumasiana]OSI35624.1 protein disulfide oxidoreductase [Neisseria dumasiana]UOO84923.1 protein disulfide oxidoreductase [Neisseria dumasiana]
MGIKTKSWLKNIFQTALMVLLVSFAVDWWRKPEQPLEFAEQPLILLDGHKTSLSGMSSERTAIVYFWGSWCGICRHTSPVIQRIHQVGVPVLGVALRSGAENEVRDYMRNNGMSFDTVNDADSALSAQWQVSVTPTIVLIKNGKMVHSTTGLSSYWGLRGRLWLADWIN